MIVVDTNVVVDVLRGLPQAVAVLGRHHADDVVIPSMVRFEVLAGARPQEMGAISELLDVCLDAPVDRGVADAAAAFARRYRRSHSGIDAIDFVVAATASLLDAQLLTLNVRHFPMFHRLRAAY